MIDVHMKDPRIKRPAELPPRIQKDELKERQGRAREVIRRRGLAGAIFWSRGGASQDRYQEAMYLSNYYAAKPFFPEDSRQLWSSRGHAVVLVPADGPTMLVVDIDDFDNRPEMIFADDIVVSGPRVAETVADLAKKLFGRGPVGLVGSDVVQFRWHELLHREVPNLVYADDIGHELRAIKSAAEIALCRAAIDLGSAAVDALLDAAVEGVSESEAAAAALHVTGLGGGYPYIMGISTGPKAGYTQPQPGPSENRATLKRGQLIRIDYAGSLDGYLFDVGRCKVIDAAPTDEQRYLIDAAYASVMAGIAVIAPGVKVSDVARECRRAYEASEYARRGLGSGPGFMGNWGHMLGLHAEYPWINENTDTPLAENMLVAVEAGVGAEGVGTSKFEENILVTSNGFEILSSSGLYAMEGI